VNKKEPEAITLVTLTREVGADVSARSSGGQVYLQLPGYIGDGVPTVKERIYQFYQVL